MSTEYLNTPIRAPRVPLTDVQHEHYEALLREAEALHAVGEHEQAHRVIRLATAIVRSGPPAAE